MNVCPDCGEPCCTCVGIDDLRRELAAERARADAAERVLRKVRAHTSWQPGAPYSLLAGLLESIERIVDEHIARKENPHD